MESSTGEDPRALPPSKDPWYSAPSDWESKRPGEVLRLREAPGNSLEVIGNPSAAYHVLFRTTDSRGNPSWAVTTLLLPSSVYSSPPGKAALLSYQFAYNSVNLDSAPSIGLYWRLAQSFKPLGLKSGTSFLHDLLERGWIVNTPDYWGPDAAFGATEQAGHATLDSVRAVLSLSEIIGSSGFNTVLWGYSGGTMATLGAVELQPAYAPDLNIAGACLGGLVDDISADFDHLNMSPLSGTLIAFLLGITAQYPEAKQYLESCLVDETKSQVLSVRDMYVGDAVTLFFGKNVYSYFKGGAKALQSPVLTKLFQNQARLGLKGTPGMPLFFYKAIGDQYCPITQTDETVRKYGKSGVDVTWERNTVGDHISEIENGKPRACAFISSIFDESRAAQACTVRDVTVDVRAPQS